MALVRVIGAAAALLVAPPAVAQSWTSVSPGVDHAAWTASGPNKVNALRVNLCQPGVLMRATTSAERGQRTSTWATATGVAAAVNGGFYLSGYKPDGGGAAGAGELWPDATDTDYRGWIGFGLGGAVHSQGHLVEWPPADHVWDVVNGDATVVYGGSPVTCACSSRAPRTGAGYTADGRTLFLVTVDGRTSASVGMTVDELGVVLAGLGADRAMNLDGGGSTTLWTAGSGVRNSPSDGSERTVANHLGVFAAGSGLSLNCPTGYGAYFAGSGFPDGSTHIVAEVGTTVSGSLSAVNVGTETWTGLTRLAPLPRDEASPIAAEGWIASHRIAGVDAETPSGETGTWSFDVRAPDTPGVTRQYLSVLQEGVTWFDDSWGPEAYGWWITVEAVAPPGYRAEWVASAWDGPAVAVEAAPGSTVSGWVEFWNTGTATWPAGEVKLGTTDPRDHASPLALSSWEAPNRAAVVADEVLPGEVGRFELAFAAPAEPGTVTESFGLLHEGVVWFADDGGPEDGVLTVQIAAAEPDDTDDSGTEDTDAATGGRREPGADGCGCATGGTLAWTAFLPFVLIFGTRRR